MLRFRAAAFVGSRRAGRRRRFSGRRRAGGGSQGCRAAMPEVAPADEPFRNPVGMRYRIFLFRVQCFLVSGAGAGRRRGVRPRCGEAAEVPERETGGTFFERLRPFAPSCPASVPVGQERVVAGVSEHLLHVVGGVGDLHVDDPAVAFHQFVFGIDESPVRLDMERFVAI